MRVRFAKGVYLYETSRVSASGLAIITPPDPVYSTHRATLTHVAFELGDALASLDVAIEDMQADGLNIARAVHLKTAITKLVVRAKAIDAVIRDTL